MTTSNTAAALPRTSSLARLAIAAGLTTSRVGPSRANIIASRWPDIGDTQRQFLAVNEVPSVNIATPSAASGQLFTGIAQQTLLGRLNVLADVKLRSLYG